LENTDGQMEDNILVIGIMENSMVMENILLMALYKLENG